MRTKKLNFHAMSSIHGGLRPTNCTKWEEIGRSYDPNNVFLFRVIYIRTCWYMFYPQLEVTYRYYDGDGPVPGVG